MAKQFKRVMPDNVNVRGLKSGDLKPLNITCGATQCSDNLHCFSRYMKQAEKKYGKKGVCYNCGHDSIDWNRFYKNDIHDSKYLFKALNMELIREVFSKIIIDKEALQRVQGMDKKTIRSKASKLLKIRIGKYNPYIDNRQTPLGKDNIINYAQHATATCCRACLEAWHNIPKEMELTEQQLEFCTDLVMIYVEEKLSTLI